MFWNIFILSFVTLPIIEFYINEEGNVQEGRGKKGEKLKQITVFLAEVKSV